jgi:hypothetical protein
VIRIGGGPGQAIRNRAAGHGAISASMLVVVVVLAFSQGWVKKTKDWIDRQTGSPASPGSKPDPNKVQGITPPFGGTIPKGYPEECAVHLRAGEPGVCMPFFLPGKRWIPLPF